MNRLVKRTKRKIKSIIKTRERKWKIQINKCLWAFCCHCCYSHGVLLNKKLERTCKWSEIFQQYFRNDDWWYSRDNSISILTLVFDLLLNTFLTFRRRRAVSVNLENCFIGFRIFCFFIFMLFIMYLYTSIKQLNTEWFLSFSFHIFLGVITLYFSSQRELRLVFLRNQNWKKNSSIAYRN